MFHKILVGLDNSEIGKQVFEEALSLAKTNDARLMILNVLDPFDERYPNALALQTNSIYPTFHAEAMNYYMGHWDQLKQEGIEFLRLLCKEASTQGVTAEFTQNFGEPGRTICEIAKSWKADLIMVGRRGRLGLSEFILGSVSNYVLHHAHCSVLTIQGVIPTEAQELESQETASVI
ncbi:MAG: universal stress protein [Scytonematopsis contorta HA4267-MV1]|jgi:nucleotide-binding universal stress UspA family protein|nr:universal stress protein [Scytonematopsis contorta HA4267-MV1]